MNPSGIVSVTVVIPTFNRGERLRATLNALLANTAAGLEFVEILVVDDGSPSPAAPLVCSLAVELPFSLRCLRQANSGPGAARNHGFRNARGRIVIFVDDDIIAAPDLIQQHLRAHEAHPRSVIYGLAALVKPAFPTPLYHFLVALYGDSMLSATAAEFVDTEALASGHISVEREMFDPATAVYRDDLSTAGGEEFALAYRLQQSGIRLLLAPRIVAIHDQPVDLATICRQQYKHALGAAEVMAKYPAARGLPALERTLQANLQAPRGFTLLALKRRALRYLAISPVRQATLRVVEAIHSLSPSRRLDLRWLYWAVVSAHYHAGLRDGSRRRWSR